MFTPDKKEIPSKAIAYYRHSAEDKQENSVPIQREKTEAFALKHELEIIHEEADEGYSGLLGLESRPAFKRLFEEWIENPTAPPFDVILVYDESRWGRFQDPDEAAALVYRCTQIGKQVVFVARGFPAKDQMLVSHLNTFMQRYMAADYSKTLSEKVFAGCVKVSQQGYSAGGSPCYGMARMMLNADKSKAGILKPGEHKAISNARVTFVPADDETTKTVRDIFEMFTKGRKAMNEIAADLNAKGIPSAKNKLWDRQKIARILTNETYTGARIYNKKWGRLKQKSHKNPRSEWVVVPNAFPAVIDPMVFKNAQEIIYWAMTKRRKGGFYLILRTKRRILQELQQFLMDHGIDPNESLLALNRFPIIYSVTLLNQSSPQWCFVIPDQMRANDLVLGVGIEPDESKNHERIFAIPTSDLGIANFCMFSEQDDDYSRYFVKEDQIGEKVLSMTRELIHSI